MQPLIRLTKSLELSKPTLTRQRSYSLPSCRIRRARLLPKPKLRSNKQRLMLSSGRQDTLLMSRLNLNKLETILLKF